MDGIALGPVIARHYAVDPVVLAGGRYRVSRCLACATIYHTEVAGEALLTDLYDVWLGAAVGAAYRAEFDWLVAHPRQSRDGHEIMTAASFLEMPLRGLKTLDYGMGQGLWARVALGLGAASHGFDLSETRMRAAREHGVATIGYGDIEGGRFDLVNTEQVMEHVTAVEAVMAQLSRGLRPGGLLKIAVPAQAAVDEAIAEVASGKVPDANRLMPAFPLEHVNAFTSAGLLALGERFGLQRVTPTLAQRFAFLRTAGTVSTRRPKNAVKELVRPFIPYESRRDLTIWLQAPVVDAG
ncbi:class I SAM-dependent methyltransferase [Sphingomonas sp. PAMC 26605]|uniref:class I SAM-dependent methyltransferase n=1 Tax=Sphingomonas sp. PAMC 26605 TaxID=1112214 RepID=UPI0012F4FD5F|nr:methyltransferase domain-containing protein [Sphingomonas sp. PAMC 26605]